MQQHITKVSQDEDRRVLGSAAALSRRRLLGGGIRFLLPRSAVAWILLRHEEGLLLPGHREAGDGLRHPRDVAQLRQVQDPARGRRRPGDGHQAEEEVLAGVLQQRRAPEDHSDHGPAEGAGRQLAHAGVQERQELRVLELRVEEARDLLRPGPARVLLRGARLQGTAQPHRHPRRRRDRADGREDLLPQQHQGRHQGRDRVHGEPGVQQGRRRRDAAVPGVPVRRPRRGEAHRLPAADDGQLQRQGPAAGLLIKLINYSRASCRRRLDYLVDLPLCCFIGSVKILPCPSFRHRRNIYN